MDKLGELAAELLGLTPKYGEFIVYIFIAIIFLVLISIVTNKENQAKIINLFIRIVLLGFLILAGLYIYKELNESIHSDKKILKKLSMKESIDKFIDDFNHGYYEKTFKVIAPSFIRSKGYANYAEYRHDTNQYPSRFDFQDIDEENHTFNLIRTFKNKKITYQKIEKYRLENKGNYWYIIQKLYSNKILDNKIKYEGKNKEGKAVTYVPDFRKDNYTILESYSYKLIFYKSCIATINEQRGEWFQDETGFFIKSNFEQISFEGQGIDRMINDCIQ